MHAHLHTYTQYTHIYMHTYTHVHTHTCIHTHMHAHIYTYTCTYACTHITHMHMYLSPTHIPLSNNSTKLKTNNYVLKKEQIKKPINVQARSCRDKDTSPQRL